MNLKKGILPFVENHFIKNGFKFIDDGDCEFIKEGKEFEIKVGFSFISNPKNASNTTFVLRIWAIEKILMKLSEIGYFYNVHTFTIQDKDNSKFYAEKRAALNLTTESGFQAWAALIIQYVENEGAAFIKKYTYLPNILKRMYELEEQGELSYGKILFGQVDHIFRALIVAKLCKDPNYSKKIDRYDNVLLVDRYIRWQPYYLKLKDILDQTEPVYDYQNIFPAEKI